MHVEYRPIGHNHRVVAVLELVDGKPAREIPIRKYIKMLKKGLTGPEGTKLAPLKNVLRDYLRSHPEYAVHLRFKDAGARGLVHITDGKFVLKQITMDELKDYVTRNESFVDVITYRQIARQTDNYKNFGRTETPTAPPTPSEPTPEYTGWRGWLNDHGTPVAVLCAIVVVLAFGVALWPRLRGPAYSTEVDYAASAEIDHALARHEAAVRLFAIQALDDPQGAERTRAEMRRFLIECQKHELSPEQTARLHRLVDTLATMESITVGVPSR